MHLKRVLKHARVLIISAFDFDISADFNVRHWSARPVLTQSKDEEVFTLPPSFLLDGWHGKISHKALEIHFNPTEPSVGRVYDYSAYSSAVLNGGYQQVKHYINLHVSPQCIVGVTTPESLFVSYCKPLALSVDTSIGMMTAASMRSCCITTTEIEGQKIIVCVTTGLGNLRCAGDKAEYRHLYSPPKKIDTINMLIATSAALSPAAKVEALMIATEAKVAALDSLGLKSVVSGRLATGTGTDALAIVSPELKSNSRQIDYVGKHTLFGEALACLTIKAITHSASKDIAMSKSVAEKASTAQHNKS
ncbi:MAG: adenosylcobinamide amidohydrolase [Cellvibrionaceae bacterium]